MGDGPDPHGLHAELGVHDGESMEAKRTVGDLPGNSDCKIVASHRGDYVYLKTVSHLGRLHLAVVTIATDRINSWDNVRLVSLVQSANLGHCSLDAGAGWSYTTHGHHPWRDKGITIVTTTTVFVSGGGDNEDDDDNYREGGASGKTMLINTTPTLL